MRHFKLLTLTMAVAAGLSATPITFVHSSTATGTIGGTVFENAAFTITALGDTTNRGAIIGGFYVPHASTSISIAGVGDFSLTTATRTFVNNNFPVVGISNEDAGDLDLTVGPGDPGFALWDMLSAIGPVTGSGDILQWSISAVMTSGGVLEFEDDFDAMITFQAFIDDSRGNSPTSIPEPATWTLLGLGLSAAGVMRVLRRRRAL